MFLPQLCPTELLSIDSHRALGLGCFRVGFPGSRGPALTSLQADYSSFMLQSSSRAFPSGYQSLKPPTHLCLPHIWKIISPRTEMRTALPVPYTLDCTFSYSFNPPSGSLPCPSHDICSPPTHICTYTFPGTSSGFPGLKLACKADGKFPVHVNCQVPNQEKKNPTPYQFSL